MEKILVKKFSAEDFQVGRGILARATTKLDFLLRIEDLRLRLYWPDLFKRQLLLFFLTSISPLL